VARQDEEGGSRRLLRRILMIFVVAVAAIYAVVRALDLDVDTLLHQVLASGLVVLLSMVTALIIVAVVKFFQR
jgi:membrane protein YdbS with pleckstrin-like domain